MKKFLFLATFVAMCGISSIVQSSWFDYMTSDSDRSNVASSVASPVAPGPCMDKENNEQRDVADSVRHHDGRPSLADYNRMVSIVVDNKMLQKKESVGRSMIVADEERAFAARKHWFVEAIRKHIHDQKDMRAQELFGREDIQSEENNDFKFFQRNARIDLLMEADRAAVAAAWENEQKIFRTLDFFNGFDDLEVARVFKKQAF